MLDGQFQFHKFTKGEFLTERQDLWIYILDNWARTKGTKLIKRPSTPIAKNCIWQIINFQNNNFHRVDSERRGFADNDL